MSRPNAPDLAYLVAIGHRRYRAAAATAVRSLIDIGGFDGRVVVFSDRPMRLPAGVERVPVDDPALLAQPKRLKLRVGDFLPLERFRNIFFLDADLVVRGGLLRWIREPLESGALVCTDDIGQTVDQGLCGRCLNPAEYTLHAGHSLGVNSGFFAASGERLRDYLAVWENGVDACADKPGPGFDQPALNAAMLRADLPVCMVRGLMWFPRRDPDARQCLPDAPLVHFHGAGRSWGRNWRMRAFARRLRKGNTGF